MKEVLEVLEDLKQLSEMLCPDDFVRILEEGAKFTENVTKFEEKLNKELDKKVKDGEITEHEARMEFYKELTKFTEDSAHKTAMGILGEEEDDDDSADETDGEEETEEESNVDFGDPSGDRGVVNIHIHCHRNDRE